MAQIAKPKDRKVIVESMAKKLAGYGEAEIALVRKKTWTKRLYVTLICFLVLFTLILIGFPSKKEKENETVQNAPLISTPLIKLTRAYREGIISADQYTLLLSTTLVRYDSLPIYYKTSQPIINADDIYKAIESVWPQVSISMRKNVLKELPLLEGRVELTTVKNAIVADSGITFHE